MCFIQLYGGFMEKRKIEVSPIFLFSIKKQENHISYKPFGGCFEDENDSQYNLTNQTENKQKQTTDKKE